MATMKEMITELNEIKEMFSSVNRTTEKNGNVNIKAVWYTGNGWAYDIMASERKAIANKVVAAVKAKIGMPKDAFIGYTTKMVKSYEKKGQTRNLKIANIINQNIAKLTDTLMEANGYTELKDAQIRYFEIITELSAMKKDRAEAANKIDNLDDNLKLNINIDDMINNLDGLENLEIN